MSRLILYYSAKGVARKSIVRQMEKGIPNEDPEEIEGNCFVLFSLYICDRRFVGAARFYAK